MTKKTPWKEWALDVTFRTHSFAPVTTDGQVVFGLAVLADRSPGHLVGVVSQYGDGHAETWKEQNPNWLLDYSCVSDLIGEELSIDLNVRHEL